MSENKEYNFKLIEKKWQKIWLDNNSHTPDFSDSGLPFANSGPPFAKFHDRADFPRLTIQPNFVQNRELSPS